MSENKVWLALSVSGPGQHAGNGGYDDWVSRSYHWDSTVPHWAQIRPGDLIAIWNKFELVGASLIDSINVDEGRTKEVFRCPHCEKSTIKRRLTMHPLFKCHACSREFDDPHVREIQVDVLRSNHGSRWVALEKTLVATELRNTCQKPRSQQSFRLLDFPRFEGAVKAKINGVRSDFDDLCDRFKMGIRGREDPGI